MMRRGLAMRFLALLFFAALTASAQDTFIDGFSTNSYSTNNGTKNFASNWSEHGDDNSPNGGKIWIQSGYLVFGNLDSAYIDRNLNLSGYQMVTLSFDYALYQGNEGMQVQLYNGSGYTTIGTVNNSGTFTYVLAANQIGPNSSIRFKGTGGNWSNNDIFLIDNVRFTAYDSLCAGEVAYEFYDLVPPGNTVNNIPTSGGLATGTIATFDVNTLQGQVDPGDSDSFSIRYTGFLQIDNPGTYTFYTSSDDGSRLVLDGTTVVNNDGDHGTQERSGSISLTAGLHPIVVTFYENGGGQVLSVQYQGPSIGKQDIPFTKLYADCGAPPPDTTDTDGDGVYDTADLDDDNDGILDTNECSGNNGGEADSVTNISYFNAPSRAKGVPGSTYAYNPTTYPGGSSVLLFHFPTTLPSGTQVTIYLGADPSVGTSDMQLQYSNASGGSNGWLANANGIPSGKITAVSATLSSATSYLRLEAYQRGARVYGMTYNGGSTCYGVDTDGDGVFNQLDLDSDNDGIPDNVEGQSTTGYTAPANADSNGNGLDNAYETNGIIPQDTDGDGTPDFLDTDSDGDGTADLMETWFTLTGSDSDGDGLDNATDATNGYADPGGRVDNPLNTNGGSYALPDTDNDATTGGDVDYRDAIDNSGEAAPVVTATGNQLFCPGGSIPIAESIEITDADDTSTSEVWIQISSGYVNGEDVLTLTGSHPNITASWDPVQGELTLEGPATYAEFEAAILQVMYSSSGAPSGVKQFSITVGEANYLPASGHYYEYVPSVGISWTAANAAANSRTYFGLQGYLATLTTQAEADFSGTQASGTGWIGASDAETEGTWKWVTGPEAGTIFWYGNGSGYTPNFAFWNNGEPNQSGDEDYAHITDPSINPNGSWNDLPNTGGAGAYEPQGYVVEYGGMPGDPVLQISAVTTITIDNIDPTASNPAPVTVYCTADIPVVDPTVVTDEADNCASNPTVTFVSDVSNGGSDPEIITRTYRVTDNAGNSVDVQQTITVYQTAISGQPANQAIVVGNNATYTITANHADTYQWQVSTDGGTTFSTISNGSEYSGATTATLTVLAPDINKNGYLYRALASLSGTVACGPATSNNATLGVHVGTVITNRRITYRVQKPAP